MKADAEGTPQWQLGGVCDDAPAGGGCSPQAWEVIQGHHLLEDGTLVLFNNRSVGRAQVLEFRLDSAAGPLSATLVSDHAGTATSSNLGDVQRLPHGNTLSTSSAVGEIIEVDSDGREVQTFSVRIRYTSWRPTLHGPPLRPWI